MPKKPQPPFRTVVVQFDTLVHLLQKACCLNCSKEELVYKFFTNDGMNCKFHLICSECKVYHLHNTLGEKTFSLGKKLFREEEVEKSVWAYTQSLTYSQARATNEQFLKKDDDKALRKLFGEKLKDLSTTNMKEELQTLLQQHDKISLAGDFQYASRRNAEMGNYSFISHDKIVDYQIVQKKSSKFPKGTYEGSSKGMEVFSFNILLERLLIPNKDRVSLICLDGDKAVRSLLASNKVVDNDKVVFDLAHYLKSLKKNLKLSDKDFSLLRNYIFKHSAFVKEGVIDEKLFQERLKMGVHHFTHISCNEIDCCCSPIKKWENWKQFTLGPGGDEIVDPFGCPLIDRVVQFMDPSTLRNFVLCHRFFIK